MFIYKHNKQIYKHSQFLATKAVSFFYVYILYSVCKLLNGSK